VVPVLEGSPVVDSNGTVLLAIREMIEDSCDLVVSKLPPAGRRALG
jgi:hypothetical protein